MAIHFDHFLLGNKLFIYGYLPVHGDVLFCLIDDLDNDGIALPSIDGGTRKLTIYSQDILCVAKPGVCSFLYLHN
jgi:hypothetical protein